MRDQIKVYQFLQQLIHKEHHYKIIFSEEENQFFFILSVDSKAKDFVQKIVKNQSCFDLSQFDNQNEVKINMQTKNKKSIMLMKVIIAISYTFKKSPEMTLFVEKYLQDYKFVIDFVPQKLIEEALNAQRTFSGCIFGYLIKLLKLRLSKKMNCSVEQFLK